MIALFDTSTLIYLLKPDAPAPFVAGTQERVEHCQERISFLLTELQRAKAGIIIPTPVIAELLVLSGGAGPEWLRVLTGSRHFRPTPFDVLAAVECAELTKMRLGSRKLSRTELAKAKFDEQIVAIARVTGTSVIFSDDGDIERLAGELPVRGIEKLPLPPGAAQGKLDLEPIEPEEDRPAAEDV